MTKWITVADKTVEVDGVKTIVPDYPTYYRVDPKGGNGDGTFTILVDDER